MSAIEKQLRTGWLAFLMSTSCAMAAYGQAPASQSSGGAGYFAGTLVNDARDALRDPGLPASDAARQAMVLLDFATRLEAADDARGSGMSPLRTLKLLAQAARIAGRADVERDSLRKIIPADPGDLVCQVRYIELTASNSQALEERARIFDNALQETQFNPQIRSEMAVRLARLAEERGDTEGARQFLRQALKLNDMNVGALRDQVRLSGTDKGPAAQVARLNALAALLTVNPYEPDAWLDAARICQTASLYDRAADFLNTAAEQSAINGTPPGGELILDYAIDQAIAGGVIRHMQALQALQVLTRMQDAPLTVFLAAAFLDQDDSGLPAGPATASSSPGQAATRVAMEDLLPEIRKRLAALAKSAAGDGGPAALADAAGIDLSILPTPGPDTASWIDQYAGMVVPEDMMLARLRGWMLYRQGKLAEAQAAFEKTAPNDLMAQLGLARVLIDLGKKDQAGECIKDLWGAHPSGLLALQVAQAARRAGISLPESPWTRQLREAAAKLTPGLVAQHRAARDWALMSVNYRKSTVSFAEPVLLTVRITNTASRALPVGPDGAFKTIVGLAALNNRGAVSMGIYAVEDLQRVYRIEPQQIVESTLRVDQGKVADLLAANPERTMMVNVTAVIAPRVLSASEYSAGTGGQATGAGDFEREGYPMSSPADVQKLTQEIATLSGDKKLARIRIAGNILHAKDDSAASTSPAGAAQSAPAENRLGESEEHKQRAQSLRTTLGDRATESLFAALMPLAKSTDPLVRADLLRALQSVKGNLESDNALEMLAADPDPLVRLMWLTRQAALARNAPEAAIAALQSREKEEQDAFLKDWIAAALPALRSAISTAPDGPGK